MRLGHFIRTETEAILRDWQLVVNAFSQAPGWGETALGNHGRELLAAMADGIEQTEPDSEQPDKPLGLSRYVYSDEGKRLLPAPDRNNNGSDLQGMVTEFLALRTCVLKRWAEADAEFSRLQTVDLIRFNDVIDKAVTTALKHYSGIKDRNTRLLTTLLQTTPDATYVLGRDRRFTYANRATEELYALPLDELIGSDACGETFPFSSETQACVRKVIATGRMSRSELTHAGAGGEGFYEHYLVPVYDDFDELEAIIGISHDITERKRAEEKVWHDANYDPLTGLPNRRLFLDRLEQAIEHSARNGLPLAVLYIDVDDFRAINESMGREVGDRVLRGVAKRLKNCIRKADTAARQGGDEFAVILTDLYANRDMRAVAEKISDALKVSFKDKQGTLTQISVSIGITLCPKDGITAGDLLRNADRASYKSKTSRHRQICFYGSAKTDPPQPDANVH